MYFLRNEKTFRNNVRDKIFKWIQTKPVILYASMKKIKNCSPLYEM